MEGISSQKEKGVPVIWIFSSRVLVFGFILLLAGSVTCRERVPAEEVIRLGNAYPEALCAKIEECARQELQQMTPEERKFAVLPTKENCIEDQKESRVLPVDIQDPAMRLVTRKRMQEVQSCLEGIQASTCDDLEESYSIPGCQDLYNIGN